jgi:predicted metal-dependent enzyme (double-stranded beta helix superfamily)
MAYDLSAFCSDLNRILKASGVSGLPEIAQRLKLLLANPAFVAQTFSEDTPPGKRVLFHDEETDAYVLAHVQPAKKTGSPHSHGASWAVYGNARGFTEMTEWRRVNGESEGHAVLEVADRYRLEAGEARAYGPNVIHSTGQPEQAWVIRVTGTDLDVLPRFHFRPGTDEFVGAAAGR